MKTQNVKPKVEHTPGPWINEADFSIVDECGFEIAYVETSKNHKSEAEAEANARLIAAAPELLQALQDIAYITDDESTRQRALRAIAKAEEK